MSTTNAVQVSIVSLLALTTLALSTSACATSEFDPDVESDLRAEELAGELEDAACPDDRQIARRIGAGACPAIFGWSRAKLFPGASGELAEYCAYTWGDGSPPNISRLHSAVAEGLLRSGFGSDCEVVFEQSLEEDALWSALDPDIERLFHHAVGRAGPSDLDLPTTEGVRAPVVVAVVDSMPHSAPADPRSEHGGLMAAMIDDIACPDPNAGCAVSTVYGLGLPRVAPGQVDLVRGGVFGSQADVAKSIYNVVKTWETTDWGGDVPKLVINLSLGWEGAFFGGEGGMSTHAVHSVHVALEYASCHGALVIAAAGNQGHLCTAGPLMPGAWEQHGAPGATRCAELGAPAPTATAGYRPLLYSVGGLTHEGASMPGSRVDGMPRLAAAAVHAPGGGDSTALTGTSVASAVGSAAAALIWSYAPHLSPAAVMGSVYRSGTARPKTADYIGPGSANQTVRAINVCAALEDACARPAASCPALPLACLSAPAPLTLADLFTQIDALVADHQVQPNFGSASTCASVCGLPAISYGVRETTSSCPDLPTPTLPYTEPQPTQVGCPNCTLNLSKHTVHASLDPAYDGAGTADVTVAVNDGFAITYFSLGQLDLSADEITTIALPSTLMPAVVRSATISMGFAGQAQLVVDDLLVE